MSKPPPARYRTTNWSSYNTALRKRGSMLIWVDQEMAWLAPHEGRLGRPPIFSDAAIQFCLSVKVLFKLPLRQTAGMVASLLRLAGLDWSVPDFSTLCRINANVASWLLGDPEGEDFKDAFHAVAHECAHVELNAVYDRQFPGRILRQKYSGWFESLRGEAISACWDEYAATFLSAGMGGDPTQKYEDVFLGVLAKSGENVRQAILKYRTDGDLDGLVIVAQENLGNLMKFASYVLGNNDGFARQLLEEQPKIKEALEGHWFEPFFNELHESLKEAWGEFGKWESLERFERIGDIWQRLWADRGLEITPQEDGGMYINVPFTPDTSPLAEALRRLSSLKIR